MSEVEREPPFSIDAEMSVLGAFLVDPEFATEKVLDVLQPDDFYGEKHRTLFRVLLGMIERGMAIDPTTVLQSVRDQGELDRIGGVQWLAELADAVPTAANVSYHANIVKEKSQYRRLIAACTDIIAETHNAGGKESVVLLDKAQQLIMSISADASDADGMRSVLDVGWEAMAALEKYEKGLSTGLPDFDSLTNGLYPGKLILIAARPGVGKTSFGLNIAAHVGLIERKSVGVFSLEMSREEVVNVLFGCLGSVDVHKIKRYERVSDEDARRLTRVMADLKNAPIYIDDRAMVTVSDIRARARKMKREVGLDLLVIDYLQLISGTGKEESRQQAVSEISRGLKLLAKELKVPVIALSQLSRATEARGGDKRPQMSDLRESGSLEQDADIIVFLYRPGYYGDEHHTFGPQKAEIIVAKHRGGPVGTVRAQWEPQYTRFTNASSRPDPDQVPIPKVPEQLIANDAERMGKISGE